MTWEIDFISEADFTQHVQSTIATYSKSLGTYDLAKFNKNTIDPIKMIFDKAIYKKTWEELIASEIARQRGKSQNNGIGYFHQNIFAYIDHCSVPRNGKQGGWDVIYDVPEGYAIEDGKVVHRIYVEMKNKHNTMNSSSQERTYAKMKDQLFKDDCACFLVEAIAGRSQDITWKATVKGEKQFNTEIRRVSIDKFYEIVTGESDAFFQVCMALPRVVGEVLSDSHYSFELPKDTVYAELSERAAQIHADEETSMLLTMYLLGFEGYNGFASLD